MNKTIELLKKLVNEKKINLDEYTELILSLDEEISSENIKFPTWFPPVEYPTFIDPFKVTCLSSISPNESTQKAF